MTAFISNHILDIVFCLLTLSGGIAATMLLDRKANQTHSYQLRSYIPTVWTSLGIFFTFVSIYISLMWKFNGDDIEQLVYSLVPAFSTSILGIAGAVCTSIRNKWKLSNEEKSDIDKFNELNKSLSLHRQIDSPELVLFEIVDVIRKGIDSVVSNTNKNQKQIEVETEKRASDLSALLNALNTETIASISHALQTQKKDFEFTIGRMETSFQEALNKQNISITGKMEDLNKMLKGEIEQMQAKNEGLISKLVEAESKLLEITKNELANESKNRNEQLQTFITDATEKISGFIDEQMQQYKGINDNMNVVVTDIRKLFEVDVKQTIEQFAEQEHKISAETITLCNNKLVEDAGDYLNNHMSAISVYLTNLDNQTKTTYESFKETVNGIAQTVASKLQELYDQQTSLIGGTIDYNKDQIEAALSTNSENIKLILGANKEAIESVSNEIKADNSSIKNELAAAQQRWKENAKEIEKEHLDEIKNIHSDAEKDIQEILTKITNYDSSIQQKLGSIKDELIASVGVFKDKISGIEQFIIDNNKGLQMDLSNQIHDAFQIRELELACSKLKDGIDSTINSLNANTLEIINNLSAINASLGSSSKTYIDTVVNSNDLLTYINETLLVDKENITSVAVILSEMETLKKVAAEIEENIKRIQSIQGVETGKTIRGKKQEL